MKKNIFSNSILSILAIIYWFGKTISWIVKILGIILLTCIIALLIDRCGITTIFLYFCFPILAVLGYRLYKRFSC